MLFEPSKSFTKEEIRKMDEENERKREIIEKLIIFPAGKKDYEDFKGYEVEIVEVPYYNKGIWFNHLLHPRGEEEFVIRDNIIDNGVEAIINATGTLAIYEFREDFPEWIRDYYGLPIKRKKKKRK